MPFRRLWLSFAALSALALAGLILWSLRLADLAPPVVEVAPLTGTLSRPDLGYLVAGLDAQLVSELSHFRALRVRDGASASPPIPNAPTLPPPDYRLAARIDDNGGQIALTATLTRSTDATVIWSGRTDLNPESPDLADRFFATTRAVAALVAGGSGVIATESREHAQRVARGWGAAPTSEFLCYILWQSYDATKAPTDGARARQCLDRWVAAGSRNGGIWVGEAFMLFLDWSRAGRPASDPMLDQALAAAAKAILYDPTGSEGHEVQATILQARGDLAAAEAAFAKAIHFNPSNPDLRAKIGWQHCLAGDWAQGVEDLHAAMAQVAAVPGWYRLPLALDAFRRGDFGAARQEAVMVLASGDPRGMVLALAAAEAGGDGTAADEYRARLATLRQSPTAALAEIRAVLGRPEAITPVASALRLAD